ncbi:MAG: ATP-binding protein [Opitutaceae bacterium]
MSQLRVFISSVQKELALERAAVATVISTDPFLQRHCVPVLFEMEPAPIHPVAQPYLKALRRCAIYVLLIAQEYGQAEGEISATHHEYRLAQELKLPTLVFLKGEASLAREAKTRELIDEIKADRHTYRRFHDREDLKPLVQHGLVHALQAGFQIKATAAEVAEGVHLIDIASSFEAQIVPGVLATSLTGSWLNQLAERVLPKPEMAIYDDAPAHALATVGLATFDAGKRTYHSTAAALLLFGDRPADRFPQAEILLDAFDSERVTGRPKAQVNINVGLPDAIVQALKFIDEQTFHPHRVVGINNVRLDEYPVRALREALVNAFAHRRYDDASRKTSVRVFRDRIEVASPGYPPQPITLAKLRAGNYRPASRNPLIAQTLAMLSLMEQRGSGFARMRDAMLDHGLDGPAYGEHDGFFVVTFPGPNGNYDRLKPPGDAVRAISPAVEARLNARQRKIMVRAQTKGEVTNRWCRKALDVAYNTAYRDLTHLVELGLLTRVGEGRSARYQPKTRAG